MSPIMRRGTTHRHRVGRRPLYLGTLVTFLLAFCLASSVVDSAAALSVSRDTLTSFSRGEKRSPQGAPPDSPASAGKRIQGWTVEDGKLDGVGFSPAAIALGRFVLAVGGVSPTPAGPLRHEKQSSLAGEHSAKLPRPAPSAGHSTQPLTAQDLDFRTDAASAQNVTLARFIESFTPRAINLFDYRANEVRRAKDSVSLETRSENATYAGLADAHLAQPAVGASSVVRVGSAAYIFGFCNTIPSFVNVSGAGAAADLGSDEFQRIQSYLLSVQELHLVEVSANLSTGGNTSFLDTMTDAERSSFVRVTATSLPRSTTLRYNATCVVSSAKTGSTSPADASRSKRIVYVIGGINLMTGKDISTVAQYDIETGTFVEAVWSLGKPVVTPGATSHSELIYILGGYMHNTSWTPSSPSSVMSNDADEGNGHGAGRVWAYNDLSVLDTANGVYKPHLFLEAGDDRTPDGRKLHSDHEPSDRRPLPAFTHGWTAPHVFVHGRTMVIAGLQGRLTDAYSEMVLWSDMASSAARSHRREWVNATDDGQHHAIQGASSQGNISPVVTGLAAPLSERLTAELHTGLLAPQRREATLVAVPFPGELKLFLLGGLVPPSVDDNLQLSSDIFSATVAPAETTAQQLARVDLVGIAYAAKGSDGEERNASSSSNENEGGNGNATSLSQPEDAASPSSSEPTVPYDGFDNKSSYVLGYNPIRYNTSFRVLLPANLTYQCPGIDGTVIGGLLSTHKGHRPRTDPAEDAIGNETRMANTTTATSVCSLMLSTSPDCDAPVAVLRNLGPSNTRRQRVVRKVSRPRAPPDANRKSWFTTSLRTGGNNAHHNNDDTEELVDVLSVGDVFLSGSRKTGLLFSYFTDGVDGDWAYQRFTPVTPSSHAFSPDGTEAAPTVFPKQTYLYVCLSTFSDTVAGCNAEDVADDQKGRHPHHNHHGWKPILPLGVKSERASGPATLHTAKVEALNHVEELFSGQPLPHRLLPSALQDDSDSSQDTDGRHRRHGASVAHPLPHPYQPERTSVCYSSFYVPLNGASPFLLQDPLPRQNGGQGDDSHEEDDTPPEDGASISIPFCLLGLVCLAVTSFAAIYVYRERYMRDPDYLFRCVDPATRNVPLDDEDNDWNEAFPDNDPDGSFHQGGGQLSFVRGSSNTPQLRPVGRSRPGGRSWLSKLLDKIGNVADGSTTGSSGQAQPIPSSSVAREVGNAMEAGNRNRRHLSRMYDPQQLPAQAQRDSRQPFSLRNAKHADGSAAATMNARLSQMKRDANEDDGNNNLSEVVAVDVAEQASWTRDPQRPSTAQDTHQPAPKKEKKTILDGKYRVLRRLGRGSFSVVYLVKRVSDGNRFALKYVQCSDDVGRHEAMKECEVAYALQGHPNVIELVDMFMSYRFDSHLANINDDTMAAAGMVVHRVDSLRSDQDFGEDAGKGDKGDTDTPEQKRKGKPNTRRSVLQGERYLSLVMAYHEEGDLGQWVRSKKANGTHIPEATIVSIAFQVLSVLKFMHQRDPPIVHRDLKPENILLTKKLQYENVGDAFLPITVTDFGLSRVMDKTFCETGVGSLPYVAPECWQRRYSCKVDVWALGCILYAVMSARVEANAVRVMFSECGQLNFYTDLMKEMTETLGYSEALATLVVRLLDMDPDRRPSAEEALAYIRTTPPTGKESSSNGVPLLSFYDECDTPSGPSTNDLDGALAKDADVTTRHNLRPMGHATPDASEQSRATLPTGSLPKNKVLPQAASLAESFSSTSERVADRHLAKRDNEALCHPRRCPKGVAPTEEASTSVSGNTSVHSVHMDPPMARVEFNVAQSDVVQGHP